MKVDLIFGGSIELGGLREHEVDQLELRLNGTNGYIGPIEAAALGAALTQWANQVPAALAEKAMKEDRQAREWQKSQGRV